MNTETKTIRVREIDIAIVRKPIKNLHLGVYPPSGGVRVAVPLAISDEAVRLAVIDKLGWIKRQREKFTNQSRQTLREMVSGETHYVEGCRYRLDVLESDQRPSIKRRRNQILELSVKPGTSSDKRESILYEWYRELLKERVPPLIEKWEAALGVELSEWRIRKMKTRWGSCNREARRIWLNLELAKKPPLCLEYVILHELVHLLVRHHNDAFTGLLDKHMPLWRQHKAELNQAPLRQEHWER
ncbi:MAG TPA: metal-dependent hydrolase [Myxococcales bacterium]|nr:metal-dependent hydrolase [Deltaproteobacteria bacterium]HAA53399.1 metal-dependent hydrolase [Myxococcales bacterium]|tara:strand:- start:3263 stop:3991 length:729 start_codon:yes stop_codon:yes gene_type:complete